MGQSDALDTRPLALRTPQIDTTQHPSMDFGHTQDGSDLLHDLTKFDMAMDQDHDFADLHADDMGLTLGLTSEEEIWTQS